MKGSSTPSRRRRIRRGGAVVAVTGVLALTLSGCILSLQSAVELATDQTVDCTGWTVDVTEEANGSGVGADGDGQLFRGKVFDGDGTVVYLSPEYDSLIYSTGTQTTPYTTAPSANPIVAGMYVYQAGSPDYSPDEKFAAETVGGCSSLPLAASAQLPPSQTSPATNLPSFDVHFGAAATGFSAEDLVLGGTAGPTGVTITKLDHTERSKYITDPAMFLSHQYTLFRLSEIYRVTVTGVTQDGTVTLSVPAGAVAGPFGDLNMATETVTAVVDTTGPAIDPVDDILVQVAAGASDATVDWTVPTASDPSGAGAVSCTPASGSTFPLGDTPVSCTAADALGNTSTSSFTVGVRTTPVVSITPQGTDAPRQGGSATFTLTATDDLGATGPVPATDYTVTSSVASDVITRSDGAFTVSFPHASPHTLTVVQTSTGARAELTVEVTPAATPTTTPPPRPSGSVSSGSGSSGLATTGAESTPLIVAGAGLLTLGAAVLLVRFARRPRV